MAECFNRALKSCMYQYFTPQKPLRYINVLQDLLDSYNNNYHVAIKMSANEVTSENNPQMFQILYGMFPICSKNQMKMNFKKAEYSQIVISEGIFDKKYKQCYINKELT